MELEGLLRVLNPCPAHGPSCHLSRQYAYDGDCPAPVEVTNMGELARGEKHWLCGCGFCPTGEQWEA